MLLSRPDAACPFCHGPITSKTGACTGALPGPFGLVAFSPGKCGATAEARKKKLEENAATLARQRVATVHEPRYARDL